MTNKKMREKMKRTLAALLTAGLVVTGMPGSVVEAANEPIEQTLNEEETAGAENEAPDDDGSEDDKSSDDGDGLDEQTPAGEEQTEDKEVGEDDAEEEESEEASDYSAQISGNDISGNDLKAYSEEEEFHFVGGYIELPDEKNMPVVDESAPIYDYGDEIAPLMSNSLPEQYITEKQPKTRDQSPYGSCWAHSAMALAELDMIKNGGQDTSIDYSEHHLAYFSYNFNGDTVKDPLGGMDGDSNGANYEGKFKNYMERGGNLSYAQNILTSWVGAAEEKTLSYPKNDESLLQPFDENYVEIAFSDVVHLQNSYDVNIKENRDIAKQMIMKYGGLGTSYYENTSDDSLYYNSENNSYYCDKKSDTNHAVTIVGWDDSFKKSKFNNTPEGDGAWLIRNSWLAEKDIKKEEDWSRRTYFWMSYYDKSLSGGYAFDFEPADNYQHNYQYDGCMYGGSYEFNTNKMRIANVFTARGCETGEQLKAVGIYFMQAQMPYTINVYKKAPDQEWELAETTKKETNLCAGFYTVPLDEPVNLDSGDTFVIVVELEKPEKADKLQVACEFTSGAGLWLDCKAYAEAGQSFWTTANAQGQWNPNWTDVGRDYKVNLRIKAYTTDWDGESESSGTITENDVTLDQSEFTYNRTAQEPAVTVTVDGTELTPGTDYEVSYTDNINAGTATVTVTGKGAYTGTATTTFEIKKAPLTLKAKDITMQVGDAFPPVYGYEITAGSLMAGDSLKTPVSYSCTAVNSETAGTYEIEILEPKVGNDDENNYEIKCVKGTLTISNRPVVSLEGADIKITASDFTYNGKPHTPAVAVTLSDVALTAGTDYEVTYTDNTNAGTATVTVTGKGAYTGTATTTFEIKKAQLTIKAEDVRIKLGENIPSAAELKYVTSGLIDGESLTKAPTVTCKVESSAVAGVYEGAIVPADADAGDNYIISYENGTLTIVDEYIYYTVTFDVQGHGTAPAALSSVREGTKIEKPAENPVAEGYRFTGWYKDAGCTTVWDFENDVVEENLILYAGWEKEPVALQEENVSFTGTDLTYNKTAQKPTVMVTVSGEKLTEGTDYTLTCENNINAGTATVTVTGRGDYTGTVSKDFTIKKAPINVWAKDKTILTGDLPPASYEYGMDDLFAGDTLLQEPALSCDIEDTNEENEYVIVISGADAGSNYEITHINGTLRVVAEYTFYAVTFNVQGHGTAPAGYDNVRIGDTIEKPVDPTANGYRFAGWYQDAACTIAWNFDRDTVQADLTLYAKWERESKEFQEEDVALEAEEFVYDGTAHRPKVVITVDGVTLVEGKDYRLSYRDNVDVGIAAVHVFGLNDYIGCKVTKYFKIAGLSLVIRAKNKVILIGDSIPKDQDYEYEVIGLAEGDKLTKEPSFACSIKSSAAAGQYDIVPYGAEANNYSITYEAGILTVADEYVAYTVSFDMQGHGSTVNYIGVKAGSTIDRPTNPTAEGYRFDGWYRDKACTKAWDFENDIVQTDLVLYAKWLRLAESDTEDGFAIQEIGDMYYTGNPCKPAVSVYDGETLLKAGRDYQIKYYNHTNANKDGVQKQGNGTGTDFNPALPYVEIIGKGNYTETVRVNYNILRASIGDGGINPAAGVAFKAKDQLVTAANKSQKPFTSIKYIKAMKLNVDYTLSLRAVNVKDAAGNSVTGELDGAAVPAGCSGEFLLTVAGKGNYDGSVCKSVYVADKAHLIKNATITLGKNQKNVTFSNKAVELTAAEADSADTFTVKCGSVVLKPGQDYTVSYQDNDRVGKAKLIITGAGAYTGSKTVSFTIKGAVFSANTVSVSGIEDKVYAGAAWTQNNAVLTYTATGKRLIYGMDYTISYSRNVNKGTATMTFKGIEKAGYRGSFKKTFKIMAVDINRVSWAEGMENLSFVYSKVGVKPVDEIILTDQDGYRLKNGRDYTLRYVNNKAVADKNSVKPPMVIVKGKGNYVGELRVSFRIVKADLRDLTVKTTPVAYKSGKRADYAYQPAVKLMDGKSALRAGKDYEIEYWNNTQAAYDAYMNSQTGTIETDTPMSYGGAPVAVIKAGADSAYEGELVVPLPIYQKKLNKAEFRVEPEQALYTGSQVRPAVKVYYGNELLTEVSDYTLSYGKNIKSGKNQGSVTISGSAPKFGGSITVKFDIVRKPISY